MGAQTPEFQAESAQQVTSKPLRRDAERNRQLILAAGRELFAERGLSVTLDDIAERAGVGVGTVYRRFPNRDTLVDALFTDQVDALVAAGHAALAVEDPWDGLVLFMREHLRMQQENRSFAGVVMSDVHGRDAIHHAKAAIQPLAAQLVGRAHAAKVIRPDLTVGDLPVLILMFGTILDATRDLAPALWERFFVVVLDGIRAGATTPLPGDPLTLDQIPDVMRLAFSSRR